MQIPWAELVGSVTLLALGPAVDRLVPRRHKAVIHDRLTEYWIRLDNARIPDLPVIVARKALDLGRRWAGGDWVSERAILRYLLFSMVLSALAVVSALLYSGAWIHNAADVMREGLRRGSPALQKESMAPAVAAALSKFSIGGLIAERPEWFLRLISFNVIFDLTSVACTILFLHAIVIHGTRYAPLFIALDLIVALMSAVASFAVALLSSVSFLTGITSDQNVASFSRVANWVSAMAVSVPYSLTTLLPTALFLSVLALACSVRMLLPASRRVGLTLLERMTDDPAASSMPATILTSAAWLILVVLRGAWAVVW